MGLENLLHMRSSVPHGHFEALRRAASLAEAKNGGSSL